MSALYRSREVAIKIVNLKNLNEAERKITEDEISILGKFDHPNIVKHIESYEDNRYIYIVMENLSSSVELKELISIRNQKNIQKKT